jgi:fused signal recognition particle receptor
MSFFDKFKKKISDAVEQVQTKIEMVTETVTETVSNVAQATSEVLKFNKLKQGLNKTRQSFANTLQTLLGGRKIDSKLLDEIEEILITADIGLTTTDKLIERLKLRVKKDNLENAESIYGILKEEIYSILITSPSANNDKVFAINENEKPKVILVVGVNGVGKTTTIGKLAHNFKEAGHEVMIGAADTFRAAANEQLEIWANRAGVDIVQRGMGADPASVAFDTLQSAIAKKKDIVIIDTAGRLHNKGHLMQELEKISRVMKKQKESAPDEVFLVLDATTGQNAINQAKEFMKVTGLTGIILTKLDGTAKGGVVIAIADELQIPVRYIGVGEQINDLQAFDPTYFVEALFGSEDGTETVLELENEN